MQSLIQENKPFIDFSSLNIRTKSQQPYCERIRVNQEEFNPFAPGDFAEKRVLKLVEWFSGHCRAIKSQNLPQSGLQVVHLAAF